MAAAVIVAGIAALMMLPLGPGRVPNAAPDSASADTGGRAPDSTMVFPPAVVTESAPPRTGAPGRGGTVPPRTPAPTVGSISVTAPQDAQIWIRDLDVGYGNARRDSLPPGTYAVRAVVPAIDGCDAATETKLVRVSAGQVSPIVMAPKLCGLLEIDYVARRNNQVITDQPVWYSLTPAGATARETTLAPGAKVVTVGRYRLTVRMAGCSDYGEEIEILAGETRKVSIRPIC